MKTTKASNYLAHSDHEFTEYHIETAGKIYSLIAEGNLMELGILINSFPSKDDGEFIHCAFLDKHGFVFEKKIHSMAKSYEELKRFGLI